jgi:lysyl-tRNA synthetase, class II
MMLKRVQGKASFATLQDAPAASSSGSTTSGVGAERHEASSTGTSATSSAPRARCSDDEGRAVGARTSLRLLAKSAAPAARQVPRAGRPGAAYRQRYVDLIVDDAARAPSRARSNRLGDPPLR